MNAKEGHKKMVDYGFALYDKDSKPMPSYFTHLLTHLKFLKREDEIRKLRFWYKCHPIEAAGGLTKMVCKRCGGEELFTPRDEEEPSELCPYCFHKGRGGIRWHVAKCPRYLR